MNLNKAMIIGNLTRDPETRTTPSGQSVTSFGVATNLTWTDQSGQKQTKAEFHNVVAWRKLGEICGQYLHKGSKIYIEGRLQTSSWEDQNGGSKHYKTEIVADNMIMLDNKGTTGNEGSQPPSQGDYSQPEAPAPAAPKKDEIQVENIPF